MTFEAVRLDCPACGASWRYSLGMELVCPGCGVDVLLGGDMFCGAGGSTKQGHGAGRLVEPVVIQMAPRHGDVSGVRSPDDPLYTVVTNARLGVVNPVLVQTDQTGGNGDYVRPMDGPLYAIVTKQNQAVCEPCLVQINDSSDAPHGRVRSADEPLWTVTTHRNVGLVEGIADRVNAGELDPRRLVIIDDVLYQLDLRFRMLNNRELARAMSFDDEESQYEFAGNVGEVTKQIGNAVPVRTAAALVKAILS